jgi:hypothetical protein
MDELTLLREPLRLTYRESCQHVQRLLAMAVAQPERGEQIVMYLAEGERRWGRVFEPELYEG